VESAAAFLAAYAAGDVARQKALAASPRPWAWDTADLLVYQGHHEAAKAFADLVPGEENRMLARYVASRRDKVPDKKTFDTFHRIVEVTKVDEALAIVQAFDGPADTVTAIGLLHMRGQFLVDRRQEREGSAWKAKAGDGAAKIGWFRRAETLLRESGHTAWLQGDVEAALARWKRCLAVCRAWGNEPKATLALGNIGVAHGRLQAG